MEPEAERLYRIYSTWSGGLHHWCATRLGRHVDAEFFPLTWKFKVYSGNAQEELSLSGLPGLTRPKDELSFTLQLPKPEDEPTDSDLDKTFKNICLATAKMLELDLGVPKLTGIKKPRKGYGNPRRIEPPPPESDE
jgi:hypothetical protein